MNGCKFQRQVLMVTLLHLVIGGVANDGFLGRVHAIAKRVDGAMQSRAAEIRNRTNQTADKAPDVLSKLWEYVKKNTNDPPLGRVISDITKLAAVQDELLAAVRSVGGCHTDEGEGRCKNAELLLASMNVRQRQHRP